MSGDPASSSSSKRMWRWRGVTAGDDAADDSRQPKRESPSSSSTSKEPPREGFCCIRESTGVPMTVTAAG